MKPPRPWWAMRTSPGRQLAKQLDGERRGFDDDANRHLVKLCRKFKLRYDDRIKAKMNGDKLVLAYGKLEFSLSLDLYDANYLKTVSEILLRDAQPNPAPDQVPSSATRRDD